MGTLQSGPDFDQHLGHGGQWKRFLLTLPFLLLFYVQLWHHQMWRDELNAFAIAAGSRTVPELLQNVRYEGHPWAWYFLLWLISKFSHNPMGLKVLQAGVGTALYFVVGMFSPFRWWERALLFASYYFIFEYTVLSRMYGLVLLAAFLYLLRRTRSDSGAVGHALLLGAMANLDMTGVLLSLAFALEYLWSQWKPGAMGGAPQRGVKIAQAITVYVVCVAVSGLSMLPQHDASSKVDQGRLFGGAGPSLSRVFVSEVVVPYLPTLTGVKGSFWGTDLRAHRLLFPLMLPVVLGILAWTVRRWSNLWVLLGGEILLSTAFGYLVYLGMPRHWGMTFVAFVGCLWILRAYRQRVTPVAYLLLGLSAMAGVHATVSSWQRPFSNAEATAHWMQAKGWNHLPIVASQDYTVLGVGAVLEQPMYALDCRCERPFLKINAARDGYRVTDLPSRMLDARNALHAERMVLVTAHPIEAPDMSMLEQEQFAVESLQQFVGAEIPEDNFYVYLVKSTR